MLSLLKGAQPHALIHYKSIAERLGKEGSSLRTLSLSAVSLLVACSRFSWTL